MGYIFDAMSRSGGAEPSRGDAEKPRRQLDDVMDAPTRPADLDAQLSQLTEQVEGLAAEFAPIDSDTPQDPASSAAWEEQQTAPETQRPALALVQEDERDAAGPPRPTGDPAGRFDDRLVVLHDPGSLMAEEYRSIRTQLLARCEHKRHLVHTITSATPQEGKTITSMNLGLSFAELRNRSAVVIEADLRLPTFAKLADLAEGPGMIDYLRQQAELNGIVRSIAGSRLHVIPAGGRCSSEAIQLLSNARMVQLLRELRERYDHVIIDTPPVTELADAGILGALSDEVMLVVRMNRTPESLVEQAVRTLRGYNAPVAGVIATDQMPRRKYHYYRYGYRYRYYTKEAA